ncbi:MAG: sigma-70 family RNA polymerase sigma factor [Paludibacter sp.]|nr:sigma-70 family RNA polymerase sigma factor [Paludibacter sp.]MDD4199688.1 sigma-70 family RNA polymerase sigma factor [Paludibacter sp.]MDD4428707.1 sigma-70 family RNA polymerase sigma factor [Paludibacter sp.]
MADKEDNDILTGLADSKTKAQVFSKLVRLYQERLYWHVRKMVLSHEDANDILQNTFMKAWSGVANFRGDALVSTWLYRIATNETLTFLTNKRIRNMAGIDDLESMLLNQLHADTYFSGTEVEIKLQEAILTLPEKQRLVFNMKYFDDLTYEQMEKILQTSVGALKASYHHAVKKIEKYLSEDKLALNDQTG